jgi:hypothetical protein
MAERRSAPGAAAPVARLVRREPLALPGAGAPMAGLQREGSTGQADPGELAGQAEQEGLVRQRQQESTDR